MKKGLYLLAVLGLAAMWVGCKKAEEKKSPSPEKKSAQVTSPAAETAATALTLVQLKVPNMT
jgi:hypothetical protein